MLHKLRCEVRRYSKNVSIPTCKSFRRIPLRAAFLSLALASGSLFAAVLPQLEEFSSSVQNLTARVSPSVVKIQVTRYGASEENNNAAMVAGKQEAIGSGVIIDPEGYIITNAHVVQAAQKIRVSLQPSGEQSVANVIAQGYTKPREATLVGIFKEGDLALIKIDGAKLPALPLADYDKLRQGQVVFAFGSPAGLQNSVSMGVISSIARQPDPDSPFLFIQTDAPDQSRQQRRTACEHSGRDRRAGHLHPYAVGRERRRGFRCPQHVDQVGLARASEARPCGSNNHWSGPASYFAFAFKRFKVEGRLRRSDQ